jgi:hypothetical protein
MYITIQRKIYTSNSTIGDLFVNGRFQCYTLEDVVRPYKISGETAIPSGQYQVVITYSQAFDSYLPLLLNVPNFEGVRIHTGNNKAHTRGCILVGNTQGNDIIGSSRDAFNSLFKKMSQIGSSESIVLTIE